MEHRNAGPTYKRSSSCTDIIYDVMSSDEETSKDATNARYEIADGYRDSFTEQFDDDIIYDDVPLDDEDTPHNITNNVKITQKDVTPAPALLPRMRPPKEKSETVDMSALENERLPVLIEVVEGIIGDEERTTFYSEDKLMILSRADTTFVSCINTKSQVFKIPIIPCYQIALMCDDKNMNNKQNETVKSILQIKKLPCQIISNSNCELENTSIVEGQILEVCDARETNPKYLLTQSLSGEEIKLPKTLKNMFSCSVSSDSVPLPLAMEACEFPQRVVLTDETCKGRTRKMLCTILNSSTQTFFKVCECKGNLQTSVDFGNVITQLPIEAEMTFKIIERPKLGMPRFSNFNPQQGTENDFSGVLRPPRVPLDKRLCRSTSDLRISNVVNRRSNPPLKMPKPSQTPSENKRNLKSPPPPKNKPSKAPKVKLDKKALAKELRNITLENVITFEDASPLSSPRSPKEEFKFTKMKSPPPTKVKVRNELADENARLRETISSLESCLSQKERNTIELELKLSLLEVALSDANTALAIEIKRNKHIEMSERILPPIPGLTRQSPPSSPTTQRPQSPRVNSPSPLKNKPIFPPTDLKPVKVKIVPEIEEIEYEKHTTEYLCGVLDKMNLAQYKERFLEHGINAEIFTELDEEVLEKELGVTQVLHRKKLLKLGARIKNDEDISHFFVDAQYTSVRKHE